MGLTERDKKASELGEAHASEKVWWQHLFLIRVEHHMEGEKNGPEIVDLLGSEMACSVEAQ